MTRHGKTIMLQGTASDVGKSMITAALCRIFTQDGYRTAPFKSQNMSNNSYITPDGYEIGWAQGLQAEACGIAAATDMNPILLKPSGEMRSQVVVHGRPLSEMDARSYREQYLDQAGTIVRGSLERLRGQYDIVVMEGAGSPAEINLKDRDIVNMQAAAWADAPVLLVADIDRGGMFASVVGTMELLEPHERTRVKGIIVNKFRGDVSLLMPGIRWLEERIGVPVAGIVPFMHDLQLEDEDSASLDRKLQLQGQLTDDRERAAATAGPLLDIAIIRLPRISNFTDYGPLLAEPDVRLRYIHSSDDWGRPSVVIVPGSKNTAEDLQFLRQSGIADKIMRFAEAGGTVIGICGGYQMLGEKLRDPLGVESSCAELPGLGLLPAVTEFAAEKRTVRIHGRPHPSGMRMPVSAEAIEIQGYEIHMGRTAFTTQVRPMFEIVPIDRRTAEYAEEGAMNENGNVWGTYIHGIFHNDNWRHIWLNTLRSSCGLPEYDHPTPYQAGRQEAFDRLAEHVRRALDMEWIYRVMKLDQ